MPGNIFINYRREDSAASAGRLHDHLAAKFAEEQLFIDVDDIPLGYDFVAHINEQVEQCDVMISVIGRFWAGVEDRATGERRLLDPRDFVRLEIEAALARDIPIIPVFVDGASTPEPDDLPESLRALTRRHGMRLTHERFRADVAKLSHSLRAILEAPNEPPTQRLEDGLEAAREEAAPAPEPEGLTPYLLDPDGSDPEAPDPEALALLAELRDPKTEPPRRLAIGDRLADIGDPRKGVGLRADGLPDIDWVEIPGGRFLFQGDKPISLEPFRISRYPVTNAQFQAFVEAGIYRDEALWQGLKRFMWWSDVGRGPGGEEDRVWQGLKQPKPQTPTWSQANRPRENVNWYEAMAFTRWLSQALFGRMDVITLPTEVQWEWVAAGPDRDDYPWGSAFRSGHANVDEKGRADGPWYLHQTTAVGVYPQGASREGVLDLSGQVWEWCLNKDADPDFTHADASGDSRALRGGSWLYNPGLARASFRRGVNPDVRLNDRGFRLLSSSPLSS